MRWFRRLPLCVLLAAAPLLAGGACPQQMTMPGDGGPGDGGGDGGLPPLRSASFDSLPPGPLSTAITVDGITIEPGPYGGGQNIQVGNFLGGGQDLSLQCGALAVHAPELHQQFALIFNDDNATLLVSVYDQGGQLLTARPIDTRADAQAVGIVRVDPVYKKLTAMVPMGASRLIGSMSIGSCAGFVHSIVLQ